mmetsp:Transcript_14190/g.27240  ORF Transcript_14190/g.27240 Transcript_14190/m.27240 type:complete len:462 (-) Transcript_14190:439-1824(-)
MEATEAVTAEIVPPPPPSSATRGQRPGSVRPKGAKRTLLTIEQKHAIFKYKQANPAAKHKDIRSWCVENFGGTCPSQGAISVVLRQTWPRKDNDSGVFKGVECRPAAPEFSDLETSLCAWLKELSEKGSAWTDAMLAKKAKELSKGVQGETPKTRIGHKWLERFKTKLAQVQQANERVARAMCSPSDKAQSRCLQGCVALVSGAGRGIGHAAALALASAGCHVALLARGLSCDLDLVMKECQAQPGAGSVMALRADVTDRVQLRSACARVATELGGIHIVVHAAGVTGFNVRDKLPYQMSEEDERASDRVIDVNLKGAMALTRAALPFMTQATSHAQQHPRALVLISSVAGKECYAGSASYCASKWGLQGYTGCLFEDVRNFGIKVCTICPGWTNTPMVAKEQQNPYINNPESMIQPEAVASAVLFVATFPPSGCPTEITIQPQCLPSKPMQQQAEALPSV